MSSNFLFNVDIVKTKHPNKLDLYEDTIKKMFKAKKNTSEFQKNSTNNKKINSNELFFFQDKKNFINLEESYKNSLILLDMIQKKIDKAMLQKYNIETNNEEAIRSNDHEATQNILMKKKFLNNLT
ncbi:MAG: hypothetical protein OW723_02625 [Buchnera aphidicola (Acyrthosiphon caraganae)]|nr:MAG: hypothetical protein OW723_02625 [Buchnera aphidicola (Acyrthosiphon caraganae)]